MCAARHVRTFWLKGARETGFQIGDLRPREVKVIGEAELGLVEPRL